MKSSFVLFFLISLSNILPAQSPDSIQVNSLKDRYFLHVGEWDTRHPASQKIFKVMDGKIVWGFSKPLHPSPGVNQEFDDITMLPNGNIVFARMSGAGMVTPDKKLIWNFNCPPETESHSFEPIGKRQCPSTKWQSCQNAHHQYRNR